MKTISCWFIRIAEFIAATLLAAMFFTFLLQIFSRYVMLQPFGWTLELCLILWLWIVFFANAFIVRERDHVTFDILYLAAPRRIRQVFALISAATIVIVLLWSFLPTLDYIDWMKIRSTTTVREPLTDSKIPLRTIFSIYGVFLIVVSIRYAWRFVDILRNGPPDEDHQLSSHEKEPPAIRSGDDAV